MWRGVAANPLGLTAIPANQLTKPLTTVISSKLLKVAAGLGLVAGLVGPANAQVSSGLLQTTFGGGTTTNSAFSALKTGGSTTTNTTDTGGDGQSQGSTTVGASGGRTGTFSSSMAEGDSQRFAVGTSTSLGINASASSTQEYSVSSKASLGLGAGNTNSGGDLGGTSSSGNTNFKQTLGSASTAGTNNQSLSGADGTITGSFKSTENTNATTQDKNASNDVTVKGIGNTATVIADPTKSEFTSSITKTANGGTGSNSATASGSAGGSVNSAGSADASRTSFTSIFLQSF